MSDFADFQFLFSFSLLEAAVAPLDDGALEIQVGFIFPVRLGSGPDGRTRDHVTAQARHLDMPAVDKGRAGQRRRVSECETISCIAIGITVCVSVRSVSTAKSLRKKQGETRR